MIPKQRNHPNIVNKLIGKSSLKSKQVDEDLTQTCCINQAKLPLFSAPEKHTTAPLISAPQKNPHGCPVFCSPEKPPRLLSFLLSPEKKTTAAHVFLQLKHVALMGFRENKRIGPPHNLGWTHFTVCFCQRL